MALKNAKEAALQFINKWDGKGKEDEDDRSFWLDIFQRLLGVENATDRIEFQKKVIVGGNTKKIDAYIPETKVIIEQKSFGMALDKKYLQSDGIELTPYEQAKRYNDNLRSTEKVRWIITSNFSEIWIYDMDTREPEKNVTKISISELKRQFGLLNFLVIKDVLELKKEEELSIKAGEIVGRLYDALHEQYIDPKSEHAQKSLNVLCVRLVFCFYAEDAGVFGKDKIFHDYLKQFDSKHLSKELKELFRVLNQKPEERDPYMVDDLAAFPYVNGGLFEDENIEIPQFTDEIRTLILEKASEDFNWSEISPTIFGAVFESTLNPETRRSGGMHYTSVENIHKVIDPLFLDGLKEEFEGIKELKEIKNRNSKIEQFRKKLASLKFLDPACGSGNFLTETYISLRKIENEALITIINSRKKVAEGQSVFADYNETDRVYVNINQFYGIEINDFAVTVAKTALWIAESQMLKETEAILNKNIDFLPLTTNACIVEGNALRMDWNEVVPATELSYIMGNPPFVGYTIQTNEQKNDILSVYVDEKGKPYKTAGKNDYVSCWYFKSAQLMQNTAVRTAFVSTNSITQGEQVAGVWKPLYDRFGIHIDFAWKTFKWGSESNDAAAVHCVIVGFSIKENKGNKYIYEKGTVKTAENINPFLVDAPILFIESKSKPFCDVPDMMKGSIPVDDGNFFIADEELCDFLNTEPSAKPFIHKFIGAKEFLHNEKRWCLWLVNASPLEIKKMPSVYKRIENIRNFRLKSNKEATRKYADYPSRFMEIRQPNADYLIVPSHSSENREYIPIGYESKETICGNANLIIPDATIYHFGVLTSNVHMAWMRTVCGRLKSDYRYSKDIVYNNFPWPSPSPEQKAKIEQTAQAILDARALYPDCSLADLYDELTMPPELRKAHQQNDRAVMEAYGFWGKLNTESERVAELMKMYKELTKQA